MVTKKELEEQLEEARNELSMMRARLDVLGGTVREAEREASRTKKSFTRANEQLKSIMQVTEAVLHIQFQCDVKNQDEYGAPMEEDSRPEVRLLQYLYSIASTEAEMPF